MREALRSQGTVGDVADTIASAYLSEHPLPGPGPPWQRPVGTRHRLGDRQGARRRCAAWWKTRWWTGGTGLEPKVVREALTMHVDELLHTRGVLRLVKAQINGMMPGVYFGRCCRAVDRAAGGAGDLGRAPVRMDAEGGGRRSAGRRPAAAGSAGRFMRLPLAAGTTCRRARTNGPHLPV
jgi:hypothetical protein